jgi:hypothetical protein
MPLQRTRLSRNCRPKPYLTLARSFRDECLPSILSQYGQPIRHVIKTTGGLCELRISGRAHMDNEASHTTALHTVYRPKRHSFPITPIQSYPAPSLTFGDSQAFSNLPSRSAGQNPGAINMRMRPAADATSRSWGVHDDVLRAG